jgi:hypothetical protein
VIPRSYGGALVVDTCGGCNTDANHGIDQAILRDRDLSRLRAEAGVPDPRTGRPFVFKETIFAADGKRALVRWTERGPETAKFLPVPIPRADGDTDIFIDPDDAAAHEATGRARAARDGLILGEPYQPDPALLEHPPGSEVTLLMRTRRGQTPAWLWPTLAARVALAAIRRGVQRGLIESEPEPTMLGLSALARAREISLALWSEEEIATAPSRPPAIDPLLGQLGRAEHLIYVGPRDPGSPVTVMRLVLFGARLYELRLPELRASAGAVWLLDARRGRVREGTTTEITDRLRAPSSAQLAIFSG